MPKESVFTAPWYPWYVKDVLTSERVELLSLAEQGAYRRLLDKAWMEGSIPSDAKACAAVIGCKCPVKVAAKVLTMFVEMPGRPDRMINIKLEKIRKEQHKKYNKRSHAGKQNVVKRWKQTTLSHTNGISSVKHTDSDTESSKEDFKTTLPSGDIRRSHPAIVAITDITGRLPRKEIHETIISGIGSKIDLDKLRDCRTAWLARGYNPHNFAWALEWYRNGIPSQNGNRVAAEDVGKRCDDCRDTDGRIYGTLESWPCDKCRPQAYKAWLRSRGKS